MVSILISSLFVAILAAVLLQPNRARFYAAFIFASITLFHELFLSSIENALYYISAAFLDLLIVYLLSLIRPLCDTVLALQRISIVSIITNAIGCVIWYLYFPPMVYNLMYVMLYAWAFMILIRREYWDVGYFIVDIWRTRVYRRHTPRYFNLQKNGRKL